MIDTQVEQHIAQLEAEMSRWMDEVWSGADRTVYYDTPSGWLAFYNPQHVNYSHVRASAERLQSAFPLESLRTMAADMLFNPVCWQSRYPRASYRVNSEVARRVLILMTFIAEFPPEDIVDRVEARLRLILRDPYDRSEMPEQKGYSFPPDNHLPPSANDLFYLLVALPPSPGLIDLIQRILGGELDGEPRTVFGRSVPVTPYQMLHPTNAFQHMIARLLAHGALSDDLFRRAVYKMPHLLASFSNYYRLSPMISLDDTMHLWLQQAEARLVDEAVKLLHPDDAAVLLTSRLDLSGPEYLLMAAQHLHRKGIKKLNAANYPWSKTADNAIIRLARTRDIDNLPAQEWEKVVEQLRQYPPKVLRLLLPHAFHAQRALIRALGWEAAEPLIEVIRGVSGAVYQQDEYTQGRDIPNCADPTSGVIDVQAAKSALDTAGDGLARDVLKLFRESGIGVINSITLIEAVKGWNREKVEAGLKKHTQISIKAYGLLPLENEDVLSHYVTLRQSARDAQKFGMQRRPNQTAAVEAALANLAQVAGYSSVDRLEWEMEARIGQEMAASGRQWTAGEYTLELAIDGLEVGLNISRAGKLLKSVPKDVRAHTVYAEAKGAVDQSRKQISRMRKILEELLVTGETLTVEDVRNFARLPAAAALLERLILRAETGDFGLFNTETFTLSALNGESLPLTTPVIVAHPYHLYHAGVLAAWQREIVRRRVVQPFKQAYRELYILTPAELETNTYSNRFAGHLIQPATAARLLGGRGWNVRAYESRHVEKLFPGIRAVFQMADGYQFIFNEMPTTTDRIYFTPHPFPQHNWREDHSIPLADVPPLIFSEVMRDADLVVAVAQHGENTRLSTEMYTRRAELIHALLEDLGLPRVRVDGHFAYVQGKLANYRVHLGSAVIHIDPGNYLCIVPANWGQKHERLFLPFADGNDSKTSEVISKILLLINDDRIKDESILRQIRRG